MKKYCYLLMSAFIMVVVLSFSAGNKVEEPLAVYSVHRLHGTMKIDGNWNKPQWSTADSLSISNYMGPYPGFWPVTHAKMLYDDEALYIIFRVYDRFAGSVVQEPNGPVSGDACVEFFFAPDTRFPSDYFNMEINAGGTPLMRFNGREKKNPFTAADFAAIEIAHSLPAIVNPPIEEEVTWTIEYKIPLRILKQYCTITNPEPGVTWRANFYKIASKGANPHWLTWAVVKNEVPKFHLPQYFGSIVFK